MSHLSKLFGRYWLSSMATRRNTWIFRMPEWARRNPLGIFIAILMIFTGTLYATDLATSTVITKSLDPIGLRIWGSSLAFGGIVKLYGNVAYDYPLEKLGCRFISLSVVIYALWVMASVGLRGTTTVALCLILAITLEIRVAVIKLILRPIDIGGEDDSYSGL